jgi:hypothetical protein
MARQFLLLAFAVAAEARAGYKPFDEIIDTVIKSEIPLHTAEDLPTNFDWRNVNGSNFVGRVLNQKVLSIHSDSVSCVCY